MPQAIPAITAAASWISSAWTAIGPIGQAVVQTAALAGAQAVITHNSKPKARGSLIDLQLMSNAPRRLQIGRRHNAGLLVDWYISGTGDPPNTVLHCIVALSQGPCGALKKVYADGRIMSPTSFPHGVRTVIPDFRSGGDRLWITYYDGRVDQVADPVLVALGQDWTEDHKMTGIAYAVIEYRWDSDNMRQPVPIVFDMEGAHLYDRREDSTAGGSGSHRLDDPATWEYSTNPRVALDHYMLGRYLNSVRVFGMKMSSDFLPYDRFEAEANLCDEDVPLKAGGTQKRFAANGFLYSDDDYADAIRRLATCMAARPDDFGGRFGLNGTETKTPVLTIDDKHIIAGTQEIYVPKRKWAENVGGVRGYFCDPQQMNREIDYPPVTEEGWDVEDGGELRYITQDYEMEIDSERAQRLAWTKAKNERRHATLNGAYPRWCIELEKGDWFIRTGPKWGEDGKAFEVVNNLYDPKSFRCLITAKEIDPSDSAWDEELAKPGATAPVPGPTQVPAMAPPLLTVTGITITGATFAKPAVKVAWGEPYDVRARRIYIEVTPTLGGTMMTRTVELPTDLNYVIFEDGIVDGTEYSVRARFIGDTIRSVWSSTSTVDGLSPFTIGGEGLGDIVAQLDSNAETIAYEVLKGAAWRASNEARDFIGSNLLKTVLIDVQEDVDGAVSDISLIGTRNLLGTAWILNAATVIPAGEGVGSSATNLLTLRTEHDQNTADLVFLMESIEGEYAQATLTSNVDGHITGFKFWNGGSPTNSAFIILTEQFAVIGGSMTTPQVLFSVTGTEISMLNVKVNKLVADTIETEHLKINSVAEIMVASDGTNTTIPSDQSYISAISANYTSVSGFVRIDALTQIYRSTADGSRGNVTVQLKLNGTVVEERTDSNLFANGSSVNVDREWTFIIEDVPEATNTWSLHVSVGNGGSGWGSWTKDNARLIFTELKRVG